jgi:hypothetical protein
VNQRQCGPRVHIHTTHSLNGWTLPRCHYMATPSRPSTTSSKFRSKTSEISDLFRPRQHPSSQPTTPSFDGSHKAKRKLPLFSLRKKSSATPNANNAQPATTPTPAPIRRSFANTYVVFHQRLLSLFTFNSILFSKIIWQPVFHLRPRSPLAIRREPYNSQFRRHPSPRYPHLRTRLLPNVPPPHPGPQAQDLLNPSLALLPPIPQIV